MEKTSKSPSGATALLGGISSGILTLKIKLTIVAIAAAKNVVNIYSPITVAKRLPIFLPAVDNELKISTNTSIGAILLRAPTNILPNSAINFACGKTKPKNIPIAKPIKILIIKEVSV